MGKCVRICTVDNCEKIVNGHGLCPRHYYLWRKYGTPHRPPRHPAGEAEFWERVNRNGPMCQHLGSRCWSWTGAIWADGRYARLGKSIYAHRFSFELANGPCPPGLRVDHRCHNTHCVRPDHLRLATDKQNCENLSGPPRHNTSGVRGVGWAKRHKSWQAYVRHNGVLLHLGYFKRLEDAEAAVIAKRNQLFTHNDLDRTA